MKDPQISSQASAVLDSVAKKIEDKNLSMMGQRTTVLWLEYLRMHMVDILRKFIKENGRETGVFTFRLCKICYPTLLLLLITFTQNRHVYLQLMQDLQRLNRLSRVAL